MAQRQRVWRLSLVAEQQYKGYNLVIFASGNGRVVIFSPLGHQVAETFETFEQAKAFLDKVA